MKKVYAIAIIMAITAGISVYMFASSIKNEESQIQAVENGNVVVAAVDIPANTYITQEMVMICQLPVEAIHPLAETSIENAIGTISKYPISYYEQVIITKLSEKGSADKISYVLETGQRAVSIGVDEVSGISGYIMPGDYVDVIATIMLEGEEGQQSKPASILLVENLLVLETGIKETGAADAVSANYETVTLSATPEELLKLNYASTNGALRLVLRPVLDNVKTNLPYYRPIKLVDDTEIQ